ncbi:cytochrome P450 [Catenulispora pinisilvae]|uniref:cytochrome P450 n=1 Tax=Catenulispora pinisilvae TaxID=2705253 RepID=UPI0018912D99|nr:cytochrome P450 [Catenulispora pinisilvae]
MSLITTAPRSDVDIFSDEIMAEPYPAFRELRDAGPVVHLDRFDMYAVPRYREVRHVLGDWGSFSSADIAFNDEFNRYMSDFSVLRADPPLHDAMRSTLAARLARRALREQEPEIRRRAARLVRGLIERGSFDAVADLARRFPVEIVGDLIGLREEGREDLLRMIDANFNCFGPDNERTRDSFPKLAKVADYVLVGATRENLAEGSMGRAVFEAADAGAIPVQAAPWLVMAYVTAGMDTTVNALGHCLWLMAEHPDQWQLLRADRSLVPQAFREILRYESPVQAFGRTVRTDWTVEDVTLPAGAKLAVLYGSANRDERRWADPDRFDITRDNLEHLTFGYGLHACAGQALARLEGEAVLSALLDGVSHIEAGTPVRHFNNILRGLESLPVTVVPN